MGKSTSVLLTLRIPALDPPLSYLCRQCAARGGWVWRSCDNGCRLANRVTLVSGAAHCSQSTSTLRSGDTGLTLNFGNAWLKREKKAISMRLFRKYQGSGHDVNVCALV